MAKSDEPAIGIPYPAAYQAPMGQQQYYVAPNPYQAGTIPSNAVVGDPKGIPIQQTIYRDTPAPFNCLYWGDSGITTMRYFRLHLRFLANRNLIGSECSSLLRCGLIDSWIIRTNSTSRNSMSRVIQYGPKL